jgi:hypothetical protein
VTPEHVTFMRKVEIAENGCWIWQKALSNRGYAVAHVPGTKRVTSGYRVAYELFVGPIPEGLELHHECRDGRCVNPQHVRPVTRGENMLIGLDDRGYHPASHLCAVCHRKKVSAPGGQCQACGVAARLPARRQRILDAIRRWESLYGRPPTAQCWNVAMARRDGRLDLVERYESGDWPCVPQVQKVFGTWSAAIAAAGFAPRRIGERYRERAAGLVVEPPCRPSVERAQPLVDSPAAAPLDAIPGQLEMAL